MTATHSPTAADLRRQNRELFERLNAGAAYARLGEVLAEAERVEVERAARARYAEALAPPATRAGWDAMADEAEADIAAGRVYTDAEVGEYLERRVAERSARSESSAAPGRS